MNPITLIRTTTGNLRVNQLMDQAFFPGRAPRSAEYFDGCRAALEHRLSGKRIYCPHEVGSCQADAWLAGLDEGHCIGRKLYDTVQDH